MIVAIQCIVPPHLGGPPCPRDEVHPLPGPVIDEPVLPVEPAQALLGVEALA